ncbi:MAG: branched-chain amino acid ABC transporter substrate-binding protein, partial [Pusillimonas sp.]|nr:branched-chain amino acid ABC transporter substrate-binding protein [Pusillimonas sp.]
MKLSIKLSGVVAAGLVAGAMATSAQAQDINVGISLSSTGPAAALGVPERNTVPLFPTEI